MLNYRTFCAVLLVVLAALSLAHANPDPWPDYSSHTALVPYVQVLPINTSGTSWDYSLTVLQGAYESGHGGVTGIKALAVYPNGGNPEPTLAGWTGDAAYVRPDWNSNGGWHTQQGAFGYLTSSLSYYINPGQSNQLIGTALFPSAYTPPSQVFLVHVACNDGYTYYARPTIVPEPGLAATCVAGVVPFLSLIRRRRR